MQTETLVLNAQREVTLTAYLQKITGEFVGCHKPVYARPAMLILPGGGYELCADLEADPVAMPYLQAGYQVFILRYSVGSNKAWPQPLDDYEQAMALIMTNHERWHVDTNKIAVSGFSAGGHLAACAATMAVHKPAAVILGYPLTTDDVKAYNPQAPSAVAAVDEDTCPCFIFAARNDNVVSAQNSLALMTALFAHDVPFESHIYHFGPHGFSTAEPSVQEQGGMTPRVRDWVKDSIGWLEEVWAK